MNSGDQQRMRDACVALNRFESELSAEIGLEPLVAVDCMKKQQRKAN